MNTLKLLSISILISLKGICYSQKFTPVKQATTLTWFGIDFTNAKMVGDFSGPISQSGAYIVTTINGTEITPDIIRDNLYKAWNNVVLNEPQKYDLKKYFGDKDFQYSTDAVMKLNALASLDSIRIIGRYLSSPFSEEKLQLMINSYEPYIQKNATGIGIAFIVEKFDKIERASVIDVTFFDINTRKIIFYDQVISEPSGYTLSNYWAGSIHKTMKIIKSKKWDDWSKI